MLTVVDKVWFTLLAISAGMLSDASIVLPVAPMTANSLRSTEGDRASCSSLTAGFLSSPKKVITLDA